MTGDKEGGERRGSEERGRMKKRQKENKKGRGEENQPEAPIFVMTKRTITTRYNCLMFCQLK